MKKINPVSLAVGSACVAASGGVVASDSLADLCGTTVTSDTNLYCYQDYGSRDVLTQHCHINLRAGVNLSIDGCYVDAAGYDFTMRGRKDSRLDVFNSIINNANKIDIQMLTWYNQDPDLPNAQTYRERCFEDLITIDETELKTRDQNGTETIRLRTRCGSIRIEADYDGWLTYGTQIHAENSVRIVTTIGDINMDANYNYLYIGAGPGYMPGGVIDIDAGGAPSDIWYDNGGNVRSNCVNFESSSLQVDSQGNDQLVGCNY